ncbi:hypothetical protein COU17_02550 [Candidatus Kaiserbacteria bacterium CG10_big_fil_rev_8_21_14_0_10_49_17]|uniref:PilN domain-containing protein n=1 Tax=Candidatus Kaiserbacteria bacterium CG10_big_fil_rev_8_21_14_0_10_49_17 TaxID=1974609 RepID=A0A2M6WE01_9BACT|nr:MAG: hypothetical protein COU17_02550 [Candidatus Kaiserbacteria bacterium CG10_big_fil_rev_8_21_14_0_10_49_17]
MEPKFKTSFIPKQPISSTPSVGRKRKGGALSIFTLIAFILIIATIALAIGIFLYQQIITASIASKSETLDRAREAFEPALIQELIRLDERIDSAQEILNQHISPSAFFDLLERLTLTNVRFTSLSLTRIGEDRIGIEMEGQARSFNSVALQADVFGRDHAIKDPIFSDLNLDQSGNVVFTFTAFLDPTSVRFAENLDRFGEPSVDTTDTSDITQ